MHLQCFQAFNRIVLGIMCASCYVRRVGRRTRTMAKLLSDAAKHRGPRQHSLSTCLQVHPPSIYDEPTKSLSVVIPAYNEQDRLPSSLDSLAG